MSSSKFATPLYIIKNIGIHLIFVSEEKEGGYALQSFKKSYDVSEKENCDQVSYDKLITKISAAKQEKDWFAVAIEDSVELYKINPKTGKFTFMIKFQADFHAENAHVNSVEFIYENKSVVTGGNDGVVRVWKLEIDKDQDTVTEVNQFKSYKSHSNPITHLDVTFDQELVASVASGDEKKVLIHDFQTGNLLNELTFSEKLGQENMAFHGCIFSVSRRYLYTLASEEGKGSYVTRWDAKSEEFKNLNTIKVSNIHCTNFSMSYDGFYIAIGSNNGYIKSLNTRYMEVDRNDAHHSGKIECVDFTSDTRFILTCDKEGIYCFVPNMRAPGTMRAVFQYLSVGMFVFFIYRLIMERWFE